MKMTPNTIRMIRLAYGMTQTEFADRLGCSRQLITMIERGERSVTDKTIKKMSEAFSIDDQKMETIQLLRGMFEDGKSAR
ncbi:helix-turn-helix transcriptional regulator [Bacillus licheniformis]|uniref:helix-turn-helix transcriptional regulator n=1 Tax=Bacillus licheniformis TaxID=1402 RepID=UPI001EE1ED17|nr:helix-turn-helix transcriptional regulator [Bacillus licheniformis]MED4549346.1 helix-turn-helix transcriptional regulator [Bacillus licheniformis]